MAKTLDRVKFSVPSAPGTGTITVGTRSDNSFFLPAEQGAVDGDKVYYVIQKSNKDTEVGIGTIASGQTEITRDTVLSSIVGGVAGTSKINVDGTAFMALVTPAELLQSLRSVRTVTGSTDTLLNGDGFGQVTYNRSTAVAVSLAQAGTSLKFLQGWCCFLRNIGAGAATITPATSTINGATTLVLNQGDSALLVSDGSNYTAIVWAAPVKAMSDDERRALLLSYIYQAKLFGTYRRAPKLFADGFMDGAGIAGLTGGARTSTNAQASYVAPTASQAQFSTSGKTKIGNMTGNGGLNAAFDGVTTQASVASATAVGVSNAGYNNTVGIDWGSGNLNTVGRVVLYAPSDSALLGGGGGSTIKIQGSNDNIAWTDLYTSGTILASAGSTADINTGIITSAAYRYHRVNINGNGTNGAFIAEVQFYSLSAPDDMTLTTTSQTSSSAASSVRVLIEINNAAGILLNSDLTVDVSCDGGTNWTLATLSNVGTGQAGRTVAETADTACTSGSSVQARIKTLHNLNIPVHGVGLMWR